jgi:hypothetical protein
MSKLFRWALFVVALSVFGLALYMAKLRRDLDVSMSEELNRRFADASAQIKVLDGANATTTVLSEHDRARLGQAAVSEYLLSFRIAGYYTEHGAIPASVEEADPLKKPSSRDPWGKPFRLASENTPHFLIISGGPLGVSALTPQERDTLSDQPVGKVYLLNGKIIFKGDLSLAPIQRQKKATVSGTS